MDELMQFGVTMSNTYIVKGYVYLPAKSVLYIPASAQTCVLDFHGRKWTVAAAIGEDKQNKLGRGWKRFANDNDLRVGDRVVFQPVKCSEKVCTCKVEIVRGLESSEALLKRGCDKGTSNKRYKTAEMSLQEKIAYYERTVYLKIEKEKEVKHVKDEIELLEKRRLRLLGTKLEYKEKEKEQAQRLQDEAVNALLTDKDFLRISQLHHIKKEIISVQA